MAGGFFERIGGHLGEVTPMFGSWFPWPLSRRASAHGSMGRARPGNLPHSGVLSAGGVVLAEDSDPAPPPSDKDARWHDRARAERPRDRRRTAANRSPAARRQSVPMRPWQLDSSSQPAAMSGLRLSQSHAGRASTETTRH